MSASDNLSGPLFHGTIAKLKRGDVITPAAKRDGKSNWHWLGTESQAFATEHLGAAKYFAGFGGGSNLTERVYEVEPLGPTKIRNLSRSRDKNAEAIIEHTSSEGFRVKRQIWKRNRGPKYLSPEGKGLMPTPKGLD